MKRLWLLLNSCILIGCSVSQITEPVLSFSPTDRQTVCNQYPDETALKDVDLEPIYMFSCAYFFRGDGKKILIPVGKTKGN